MEPTGRRFRIAFSFAGEKRDFVAQVAAILARQFGKSKILYDKYHAHEFSRSDLAFYLSDLYEKETDLVVAVLCPDYEKKEWCGLEWNVIFGLLKKRNVDEVMLTRFNFVEGRGLQGLAGYIDLDGLLPEQAASAILERLAFNEGKPLDFYTKTLAQDSTTQRTSIPNNLPRLQPFFGREAELAQIREALDPDNHTWGTLIDGPGGMGKTALAIRAASECSPAQFKRIVFVSVKTRELDDDGLRELGDFILPGFLELLNELSRELGRADITKAAENERIRLLHEALRDQQVLLILDNLESLPKPDRNRLFTFVTRLPQGCKAILTSREPFGNVGDGFELERLSQDAALLMIAELAERSKQLAKSTEAERIALYEQTNGNPLLLRWVAGQVGRESRRTLADALKFLRSCPEENNPLEFVFGDLADDFTDDETRVLCALTYFTMPARVEHIAPVVGGDAELTETALRSLANRSLVSPDSKETAFSLVPTVADFLRHRKPEVVAEIGERLEERAYALLLENGYQQYDNFPVLDAAWPMVAAALPRFLAGPNDRLQTVCGALDRFLDFTGRWDEWLALSRDAEGKAVTAEDFLNAGWRAYDAGWVHQLREQSKEVLAYADRAGAHWQHASASVRERAAAINLRGCGHLLSNNFQAAITTLREAVELMRTLGQESEDVATALAAVADAEYRSGALDAAEEDCKEALRIAQAIDSRESIAILTGNLADVALARKDWSGAEELARKALPLAEKVGRKELIASNCYRIATALVRQGQKPKALLHAQRAVEIYQTLRSPKLEEARQTLTECAS
jgi:tetratricopeptide (TPR) repeat protein